MGMREKLIELLADSEHMSYEKKADFLIANDVVQVVRCKYCKSYENRECKNLVRHMTNPCSIYTLPNDFCSYGERREGE